MPIYLPAPEPARPVDGKGYNRLSLNAHMGGFGAQCALRPTSWATLFESYDTRRARWGGFGHCIRKGHCGDCPVTASLDSTMEQVPFNTPRVLVRVDSAVPDGAMFTAEPVTTLWMTDRPADPGYRVRGEKWDWFRLRRLKGWDLGRRHRDGLGEGFWMHRTPYAPAPHVGIRTRERGAFTRHAFFVRGTRAALLTCFNICHHDDGTLLNVIGHHTPEAVDDANVTVGWWQPPAASGPQDGRQVVFLARNGSVSATLYEGQHKLAALSFGGSQWTTEQIHLAASAMLDRTGQ